MDNTTIPEAARCTDKEDFVLLIAPTGYTSQLVRLAAVEKGANWKMFECDFRDQTMYKPWHMKINPSFTFPTLLYGNEQTSIIDELVIIQAIDEKWQGKVKLQQACIDNAEFKGRFEQLIADHYDATWRTFEMQTMNQEIWMWRWIGPLMWLSSLEMAKKSVKDKAALDEHLIKKDESYMDVQGDWRRTKPINDKKARAFLGKVAGWMTEGNKQFALGTDTYTLGDVLTTNLMSRLITDYKFFKTEVLDVPVLNSYWERMQARPSYKETQHQHKLWTMTKVHSVLGFALSFFTAIVMGILMIFRGQLGIGKQNWYWWVLGTFAGVTTLFFSYLGMKGRRIWNNHLQMTQNKEKGYSKLS